MNEADNDAYEQIAAGNVPAAGPMMTGPAERRSQERQQSVFWRVDVPGENRMSATEIRRKSAKTRRQTRTDELAPTVERNIQALVRRREQEAVNRTRQERIAEAVTAFTGSMAFVYLHFAIFGFWIVANLGWVPWVEAWDSSLVILAMVASVEAIFLSTFVLISQNRMAAADDKRAELNLQISLLAEHEITRLLELVAAVADRLDVRTSADSELDELKKDVPAEAVLDEIEKRERARPP